MYPTAVVLEKPERASHRDSGLFIRKLREQIDNEVHIKMDGDDAPITYILKEVGKDCIVVAFAQMERTIPIARLIFFQIEIPLPQ
jgi:hypothetical protein